MKKSVVAAMLLGLFVSSVSVFAEAPKGDFTVDKVTGKVEREVSAGKWEPVTAGSKVEAKSVINTGLNSSMVLKSGDRLITIKAMQKGTVEQLATQTLAAKPGIKIGAKATDSDVTADDVQGRQNVSTASTRASDATKDIEWAE